MAQTACAAADSLRRRATISNSGRNKLLEVRCAGGILQCSDYRVRDFASRGPSAQVRAMIGFVRDDRFNGRQQSGRGFLLTKVIEQQSAGPKGSDRIGNSLACDIERRTMDGFKHRPEFSVGVKVRSGRDAERTG